MERRGQQVIGPGGRSIRTQEVGADGTGTEGDKGAISKVSDGAEPYAQSERTESDGGASEMFHFAKSAENPLFTGFLIHTLTTTDKVVKYGENNKIDFSEHPTVVQRGSERTINLYAAVPDVA